MACRLSAAGVILVATLGSPLLAQVSWTWATALTGRIGAGLAYDSARDRLVVFGGQPLAGQTLGDTWENGGQGWILRNPVQSPVGRSHHCLAYDALHARVILFGGRSFVGGNSIRGDTWEWDGAAWTERFPATNPPSRDNSAMVWDSGRGRMLMFGGHANQGGGFHYYSADLWEWDGLTWTQVPTTGGPIARQSHAMAYEPVRQRLVLFGGEVLNGGANPASDTWEWDGSAWHAQTPAQSPPGLKNHTMVYRATAGRVLLFGGNNFGAGVQNAAWEWDGTTWAQLPAATPPAAREYHGMAWDSLRHRATVFGGWGTSVNILGDTSSLDAAGTWSTSTSPATPPARNWGAVAADAVQGRLVLFGGSPTLTTLGDTWESDGGAWVQRAPVVSPSPRAGHAMATDPVTGRVLLFGGGWTTGVDHADTWEWQGTTWAPVQASLSPPGRSLHALCANGPARTILLFGGQSTSGMQMSDTWQWDAVTRTWTQLFPSHQPPGRGRHGMARDASRDRTVLFGGFGPLGDTWEWNGADWQQRLPATSPSARAFPGMVYDPERNRIVVFGGAPATGGLNDTWEWDGTNWTPRAPLQSPPLTAFPMMAWDPERLRSAVVSGMETWHYGSVHPAAWHEYGAGCSSTGTPALQPAPFSMPWLGDSFTMQVQPVPAQQAAMVVVGTRTLWGSNALPMPLDSYGMPGCTLLAGGYAVIPVASNGGIATVTLQIPNQPSALGATVDAQAFVSDPAANPAGLVASRGGTLLVGAR